MVHNLTGDSFPLQLVSESVFNALSVWAGPCSPTTPDRDRGGQVEPVWSPVEVLGDLVRRGDLHSESRYVGAS